MAGNVVVIANAKPNSTLDKKQILDPNGQELYEIRDEIMSVSHGMVGHKTGGNIFECHNHKTKMGSEYRPASSARRTMFIAILCRLACCG